MDHMDHVDENGWSAGLCIINSSLRRPIFATIPICIFSKEVVYIVDFGLSTQ